MNRECIITLIKAVPSNESTATGEPIFNEERKAVYGVKKAVRQSEFFQAFSQGFKPDVKIEINSFEYENENLCDLEGQRFRIYRSYPISNSERTELYLTQLVGETDVFT